MVKKDRLGHVPRWAKGYPLELIYENTDILGLDPAVVIALIREHSKGYSHRAHIDPGFKLLFFPRRYADALRISFETEETFQSTTWGILGVYGYDARAMGFGNFLSQLCDPNIGLYWGCLRLSRLLLENENNLWRAVSLYPSNRKPSVEYSNRIKRSYADIRKDHLHLVINP